MRRRARGFTLFEVLAAVLILGLFYAVLASSAIQGLRAEGTSRRRLQASLLADRQLSELEAQAMTGGVPEIGHWEQEEGDFRVSVDVSPFDLSLLLGDDEEPGSATRAARADAGESLLNLPQEGAQSFLRTLDVRVSWAEGIDEQHVQRTSFAYDVAAAAPLFETVGGDEASEEVGGGAEGEEAEVGGSGEATPSRSGGSGNEGIRMIERALRELQGR